ncbi:MAG TPA: sporulation protein, partial [Cryptosporangiaceae bacterium]|nr:sporulation protein [Cryptosporangiaceae bacterium]
MRRQPNRSLQTLLEATGWSHAGLAKRVNQACQAAGHPRSYAATSVANWLRGMIPAAPVPQILAGLFGHELGRP